MKKVRYLAKSPGGIQHCSCPTALISSPGQLDCPWCGCGWLFTCLDCRKAFTYARCVEVPASYEELARRDIQARNQRKVVSAFEIRAWMRSMKEVLADLKLGTEYIYLDGSFFALDDSVEFDGWHSHHFLPLLPHKEFRNDPSKLKSLFSNKDYWLNSKVESEDL